MNLSTPTWLNPEPILTQAYDTSEEEAYSAIFSTSPDIHDFAALISPAASGHIENMAQRAQTLTQSHFGRTISLYVPLYLSNYCTGGCIYCGFASDREQVRRKLNMTELKSEITALKAQGFEDVLLLAGERCEEAGFDYVLESLLTVSESFHNVSIEAFSMSSKEYKILFEAGCSGITLYQETYNPELYDKLHRWGMKKDYLARLEAPARALEAGMRSAGVGVLLGLDDPIRDSICLFQHIKHLQKSFWQSGVSVSFPRICSQQGNYQSVYPVSDRLLAQLIFAFRICLPDVPLVISTRENQTFRDGIAGIGISRMSVASRTTVGGYHEDRPDTANQFSVSDTRNVTEFCNMLKTKKLEPVFKNWDSVFNKT